MTDTTEEAIINLIANQKAFFSTHQTKNIDYRLSQLRKLKEAILRYQKKIELALWADLHKSPEEAYVTEISIVLNEIDFHLKHLKKWARPERASTPIYLLPSSSKIVYEPLGLALIVSPWNYPFQLVLNPLIGAISAGCCTILKPSPDTPSVAKLIEGIIIEIFDPYYVSVVQGGRSTNTILFAQPFDLIFFTGSPKVGKVVMKAAAENLTAVILELGGKSPCIVDADADLDIAAKRIVWGKLINAGQTCIAPDYLFVHHSIKKTLLDKMAFYIHSMYGTNIKESRFYPRIVSAQAMERLSGLLHQGTIHTGGEIDLEARYIAPTIIDDIQPNHQIMQEEIFGPILPVMTFDLIDEAIKYINEHEKPLAFYYFGKNKGAKEVLTKTTSGGASINDILMHIGNHHLPFGGVGNSGMGKYHGRESFLAFSNKRGVLSTPTWLDIPLKYIPFKNFKLLKKIL